MTTVEKILREGVLKAAWQSVACLCMVGVLLAALVLACAPSCAFADEQTDSATTEVYLVPADSSQASVQSDTLTSKTGDAVPVAPFAAGAAAAMAVAVLVGRHALSKNPNGGRR